jgi:hypothetical protein
VRTRREARLAGGYTQEVARSPLRSKPGRQSEELKISGGSPWQRFEGANDLNRSEIFLLYAPSIWFNILPGEQIFLDKKKHSDCHKHWRGEERLKRP